MLGLEQDVLLENSTNTFLGKAIEYSENHKWEQIKKYLLCNSAHTISPVLQENVLPAYIPLENPKAPGFCMTSWSPASYSTGTSPL